MKKRITLLVLAAAGVMAIYFLWRLPASKADARTGQQEALAENLGVRIHDYPYPADFPVGYFYTVLRAGMTYDQVHGIVRGYLSAYQCYGIDEIYYYFSRDEHTALRFRIGYDQQGRFVELEGEDPNSRTLGVGPGCSVGLLGN
jgi:hypothetical protein